MADDQIDGGMIEIGDPNEEPKTPEGAPQVVIQYHERGGVPWMLIPPLLVISAVLAVVLYARFAPKPVQRQPIARAVNVAEPAGVESEPPIPPPATAAALIANPDPDHKPEGTPPLVPPPANPLESTVPTPAPALAASTVPASVPSPVEATVDPVNIPAVEPFPRVQGLGFDPKALEADRKVEAPADPALAPVVRQDRPDDRDLPREIDPDLLPPDPRQAKVRQEQRKMEKVRKVEDERFRFHAELRAICRKFREESSSEIFEMSKNFDMRIEPEAEEAAKFLLGRNGKFVGADKRTRVELLRKLGYPEPAILNSIFLTYEKQQIGERDGPRNLDEAFYYTALFLLRNPPPQPGPAARPVSAPGAGLSPAR